MPKEKKGWLILSDGSIHEGIGFGAETTKVGELVFSTSMTGYQEALTDPSYAGQILLLTYPLIGNYGTNSRDFESEKIQASGVVVREISNAPNYRNSLQTIDSFLQNYDTPGIAGLDTREIVRKLRNHGVMPACLSISYEKPDLDDLLAKARNLDYSKINFVEEVSSKVAHKLEAKNAKHTIAVLDCGMKRSIAENLLERKCNVIILPWNSSAQQILSNEPDGLVLSPGPGDPALLTSVAQQIRSLFNKLPIFGICLGHQILAHAVGGKTFKLKFGHRGANHPVKNLETGRITITSQNHGYSVDAESVEHEFITNRINLNDKTGEGMRHRELPIFSIQYHAEANPGPYDSRLLFDEFISEMK